MLSKSNLHDAMSNVKPSIKFRASDNMSTLMQTLVEGMRGREVATGSAQPGGAGVKRSSEGGEGGGGEEKRRKSESEAVRAEGGSEGGGERGDDEGEEAAADGAPDVSSGSPAPGSWGAASPTQAGGSTERGQVRGEGETGDGREGHAEVVASAAGSPSRAGEKAEAVEIEPGHLADVLSAAFSTKVAMRAFANALKERNGEAFKTVQLSANRVTFSNEQIAALIAACRPGQASTAGGLLKWLTVSGVTSLWREGVDGGARPRVARQDYSMLR